MAVIAFGLLSDGLDGSTPIRLSVHKPAPTPIAAATDIIARLMSRCWHDDEGLPAALLRIFLKSASPFSDRNDEASAPSKEEVPPLLTAPACGERRLPPRERSMLLEWRLASLLGQRRKIAYEEVAAAAAQGLNV